MEFRKEDENLTFIESQFATEPCINVIDKDSFDNRVDKVFDIIYGVLAKSFGPGGSGTFISSFPAYYNTKDGFNIMKNIAFDKPLDRVICDMIMKICERLNFTVGDGTTTATIATKTIYDAYKEHQGELSKYLPRDILKAMEVIKNELMDNIDLNAISIQSDDPKELAENIKKVVYISSNGNMELTNMIGELYEHLGYPAISCQLSKDGTTHYTLIEGYNINASLTDEIYVNNDDKTMAIDGSDYILFDHKVTRDTYDYILKPLADQCRSRDRHLVCIAPMYDEVALTTYISRELTLEFKRTKNVTLVLTTCGTVYGQSYNMMSDLAMLLNTELITSPLERELLEHLKNAPNDLCFLINIDDRKIDGLSIAIKDGMTKETDPDTGETVEKMQLSLYTYRKEYDEKITEMIYFKPTERAVRLGYCSAAEIGMETSIFKGFYYDQKMYDAHFKEASDKLKEMQRKVKSTGQFSLEYIQLQQRVYALGLKLGIIEVGASSDLTQGYLKDTVDDSIKAAESAYNNGVVLGCNVTMLRIIDGLLRRQEGLNSDYMTHLQVTILKFIEAGFYSVYRTIIANVFPNLWIDVDAKIKENGELIEDEGYMSALSKSVVSVIKDQYGFDQFNLEQEYGPETSLKYGTDSHPYDIIISESVNANKVLDLTNCKFSRSIINSAETDKEILVAVMDLLGLLITGNQLVLR